MMVDVYNIFGFIERYYINLSTNVPKYKVNSFLSWKSTKIKIGIPK